MKPEPRAGRYTGPGGWRHWRNPLTAQTHRDVPGRLADRLDELAAAAGAHKPTSIENSNTREQLRSQLDQLLQAFSWRVAYRRTRDEINAGAHALLPISEDRRDELADRAATLASLRDHHMAAAIEDGASLEDAALAAGITLQETRAIVHQHKAGDHNA